MLGLVRRHRKTEEKRPPCRKRLRLSSAPRSRRRRSPKFRPCRFSPSPGRRRWSSTSPTAAAEGDIADPAGHAIGLAAVPIPADITGLITDPTGLMGDPGMAAATGGIAVQAAPAIRSGVAPTRAAITAPIDTDESVEKLRAVSRRSVGEARAFGSLRQVAFQAAIRRFSAFSASASASRRVAKDISERSWAWPERKSVQR
jgi:hypothetical protein